jgi:outer membrane protein TolC
MKRAVLILVVLLFPVLGLVAQQAAPILTLQQVIDAAIAGGDDNKVLTGNLDVARAQHALNVARNALTLSANAGYGETLLYGDPTLQTKIGGSSGPAAGVTLAGPLTSVAVTASPYNVSAGSYPGAATTPAASIIGASVIQTLWNGYPGGPTQATVDKSLLTLQGKEAATDSGTLTLVYSIKQAYYTMLAAQRTQDLKTQILGKQNELLKQIKAVYDLKLASLVDLKTAQINARSAQIDVDSAGNDLGTAHSTLATLMGQPIDTAFAVADTQDPAVPVTKVDDAVAQGLARRVELKQLAFNIKSGSVDLALAHGQSTPTVSVTGGLALDVLWGPSPTTAYSLSAGVKVAMPILDAGAAQSQIDAAARQNAVYAVQQDQQQKTITAQVRSAWQGWQLALEKLDLARLQADASALQLEIFKAQFANGTVANQDLLTASVNDATAQSAVLTATSTVQLASLQLLSVMGY